MYTLAIDLGGSYLKFGLFDRTQKRWLAIRRFPFPSFLNTQGLEREVPLAPIMERVNEQIADLSQMGLGAPIEVWISNQMQGFVLVDIKKQSAHGHFISWQDQRSVPFWDNIETALTPTIKKSIGNEMKVGHAVSTLYAMKQLGQLPTGCMPISLGDFVVFSMTGELKAIHETNASGMGCWSIQYSQWESSLIASLGLEQLEWPNVTSTFQPVVKDKTVIVMGAVGDFQASLLGAGLTKTHQLLVNVATGSQVAKLVEQRPERFQGQLRPFFDGKILHCFTHLPAGRALNFLLAPYLHVEGMALDEAFRCLDREKEPHTSLKVDLSVFSTGGQAKGAGGSIHHILESNLNAKSLLQACLNAMAETYAKCRDHLDPNGNCDVLLGAGGILTQSRYLRDRLEQKMGMKVTLGEEREDALWGLLALSLREWR